MIADFLRILRAADIQVSPAEAIDAAAVIERVGMSDRALLRDALGHTLAKTEFEKHAFAECFDSYFRTPEVPFSNPDEAQNDNSQKDESQANDAEAEPQEGDADSEDGEPQDGDANSEDGGQPGGDPQGNQSGQADNQANSQTGNKDGEAAEGEADSAPQYDSLTDMVRAQDTAALQAAIADAATKVGLADAKLFTQQGMFSRRILEAMGLSRLDGDIRQLREAGETDEADKLKQGRAQLFDGVFDFVERQIAMRTKNAGRLLREDALSRIRLTYLDNSDM